MPRIRILLVDDSPEFLKSAEWLLSTPLSLEVVGLASSGCDALEQVSQLRPDLVLMDLAMPGMNGLEATRLIKTQQHAPLVVVLTLHDHPQYRQASQDAGADGFISKAELGTQLLPLLDTLFDVRAGSAAGGEAKE